MQVHFYSELQYGTCVFVCADFLRFWIMEQNHACSMYAELCINVCEFVLVHNILVSISK